MPADEGRHGWVNPIARLRGRGRTSRCRTDLHEFMHMSDRMLADIGVRRADVCAALSGLVPPQQIARTHGGAPWTAPVHMLHPHCREPSEAARDFSAAA